MKNLFLSMLIPTILACFSCASVPKPNLGKVVDGYLVNVDAAGVILQGHDPVSIREGKDMAGKSSISTRHKGAIYYFASEENKKKFLANPTTYEPAFGGFCAYGVTVGNLAPIELWTYSSEFNSLNVYQHNQKALNGWLKDIPGNYEKALQVWAGFERKYLPKK
jgi:YHS domain-containing protein